MPPPRGGGIITTAQSVCLSVCSDKGARTRWRQNAYIENYCQIHRTAWPILGFSWNCVFFKKKMRNHYTQLCPACWLAVQWKHDSRETARRCAAYSECSVHKLSCQSGAGVNSRDNDNWTICVLALVSVKLCRPIAIFDCCCIPNMNITVQKHINKTHKCESTQNIPAF